MARLLLDEDIKAKSLVRVLITAGHDIVTTADLGLDGHSDAVVLEQASLSARAVLTYNCDDFRALHESMPDHCGIILVYQEPRKTMSYPDITRALENLEQSGILLPGSIHALNTWHY